MNSQHPPSFITPYIHYPLNTSFNAAKRVHQCPNCHCLNDRQCAYPKKVFYKNAEMYGVKDIYFDRFKDRSQNSSRTNSSSNKQNLIETTNVFHPQTIPFSPLRTLSPTTRATKINIRFVSPQHIPINNFTFAISKIPFTNSSQEPPKPKVLNKRSKTPIRKETTSIYTNNQIETHAHSPPRQSLINQHKINVNDSGKQRSRIAFEYTPIKIGIDKNISCVDLETVEFKTREQKRINEDLDLNYDYLDEVTVSDRTISDDVSFDK